MDRLHALQAAYRAGCEDAMNRPPIGDEAADRVRAILAPIANEIWGPPTRTRKAAQPA